MISLLLASAASPELLAEGWGDVFGEVPLFLWLNGSPYEWLDQLMWYATKSLTWLPLYLFLLIVLFRRFAWQNALGLLVLLALLILCADQLSAHVIKPLFSRPRPTHDASLHQFVKVVNNYRGGLYGFVSSHAANTFAVATFLSLHLRRKVLTALLFAWAILCSYSRIYLGVHYPSDILFGALLGASLAFLFYHLPRCIKGLPLLGVVLLTACSSTDEATIQRINQLNEQSYRQRYLNIDSASLYADSAYALSLHYASGRAEALNNQAFVAYQQMYYDKALDILRQVRHLSRNQVETLCGEVMTMKIAQRVGEGKTFFDARHRALQCIRRIEEEASLLPPHVLRRYQYAESELHIVSATYYYYLGQDSLAIAEMAETEPLIMHATDSAQWLYYHYMLGSGGMLQGDESEVALKEFSYLLRTYSVSTSRGYVYFRANALQSIAEFLSNPSKLRLLQEQRANELYYLRHLPLIALKDSLDALDFATCAYRCFSDYHDIYQSACAKRTLGELLFQQKRYAEALHEFLDALHFVEQQSGRSSRPLPQWMAGIHEKLSLTYSALGETEKAQAERRCYLMLLQNTSQNDELQSRKEQLLSELRTARLWLVALLVLILVLVVLAFVWLHSLQQRTAGSDKQIQLIDQSPQYAAYRHAYEEAMTQWQERSDDLQEQYELSLHNTARSRSENVERRAKVSMVYAIIPYLDRIIASVARMTREGRAEAEILDYVSLLTDEIMRINTLLTEWIQVSQGQVKLHISSFPLQDLFTIIEGGRGVFERKGVNLLVDPTAAQVKADRALTLFMINTLADNARKFTPEGGKVRISAHEAEDYVEISVSDTGVGLSPEDVHTINESKVYDPSTLGSSQSEKGFGFGIMNCKGIIGKYRKTSDLFRMCTFSLQSQEGRGSRFSFRLPRVLGVLLCCSAFSLGMNASPAAVPTDTLALMQSLSDSAFAVQSRHDWEAYKTYNDRYVRLHHLYTADATLPTDCARMQQLHANNAVLYALLVLVTLLLLLAFYFALVRPRLTNRQLRDLLLQAFLQQIAFAQGRIREPAVQPSSSQLDALLAKHPDMRRAKDKLYQQLDADYAQLIALQHRCEEQSEQLMKQRYEEECLYVMNQVLDNCLSTIKHETMYYPARTQQMVSLMQRGAYTQADLHELHDLVLYYRRVYSVLHEQAYRQLEQNSFHRVEQSLDQVAQSLSRAVQSASRKLKRELSFHVSTLPSASVVCDADLLSTLFQQLLLQPLAVSHALRFEAEQQALTIAFSLYFDGEKLPEIDIFAPSVGCVPYLIAKQVMREHDAYSGMCGLRLEAHNTSEGYAICFTLKKIVSAQTT